jgi:alkylhydroperoxidase family enzyme
VPAREANARPTGPIYRLRSPRSPPNGTPFNERERALAAWARTIARSPGSSTPQDIQRLSDAGFQEPQIVALTVYAGLSMALSSIDSALGARPDIALAATVDPAVRTAVV